jgi:hypothetical protein
VGIAFALKENYNLLASLCIFLILMVAGFSRRDNSIFLRIDQTLVGLNFCSQLSLGDMLSAKFLLVLQIFV